MSENPKPAINISSEISNNHGHPFHPMEPSPIMSIENLDTKDEIRKETKKIEEIKEDEEDNKIDKTEEVNKKIKTLFNTDSDEKYITYQIYIIREGDTVESIVAKYDIDVEALKEYNDLSDLKLGDKIIIPAI